MNNLEMNKATGEVYAGVILGKNGAADYRLIRLPNKATKMKWENAKAWAKEQGGELPTLRELGLLRVNDAEFFTSSWYWSCEKHASNSNYAWFQSFYNGLQDRNLKSSELSAVAIRRVEITSKGYSHA